MRLIFTLFLVAVCGLSLGYILGQRCPQPAAPCCCRPCGRMPAVGCDCEDCSCEQGGTCVRPGRCPNVHAMPRPSVN